MQKYTESNIQVRLPPLHAKRCGQIYSLHLVDAPLVGPVDSDRGCSPVIRAPFDEPYMGLTDFQSPQQPSYIGNGIGDGEEAVWASEKSGPWYENKIHSAQYDYHEPVVEPDISGSQYNRILEPGAARQDRASGSVEKPEIRQTYNDGKDLPPLPSIGGHIEPLQPAPTGSQQNGALAPRPPQSWIDTSVNGQGAIAIQSQPAAEEGRCKNQRSETYQIRLVNWFDAASRTNPRRSPIMVQNANGPCPLLALVNALVLSTPAGLETALLDTLERREQVSLGLLLDAVIDELMSGRRGDAAQNLPDIGELYAFLVNLHTGMNVNPKFILPEQHLVNLMDAPIHESSSYGNPSGARFAGGFEDTTEMQLYSTFAIPLIHGWVPPRNHPALAALRRTANSYEDAQNLMFAEEELEDKLSRQGLDPSEQLLLEDIATIKYFLSSSATQLTGYGLDSITESLAPGQIAILFRNDHFSTLYRHPRSGQLFTLVTDMGYAGHDEVVWESLVDVSGEGCEFFAGDFRPVGNNNTQSSRTASGNEPGWTTVTRPGTGGRSRGHAAKNEAEFGGPQGQDNAVPDLSALSLQDFEDNPKSPNTEQEDHDLALALQLQEEEEERERQEIAARKRENELSQAFLESQPASRGRDGRTRPESHPSLPPRGRNPRAPGSRSGPQSRPAIATTSTSRTTPARTAESEGPPPSYEQAARGPAYHPPPNHPAHANASNSSLGTASRPQGRQRHSSAYTQNATASGDSPVASSPMGPPFANSPSLTSPSRRRSSFRNSGPGRGGLGGGEGAAGVYRRNDNAGLAADEAAKKGDCAIM